MGIIVAIVVFFVAASRGGFMNFLLGLGLAWLITFGVRHFFMKEKDLRRIYQNNAKFNNALHSNNYWNIYQIDGNGFCRYQSNKTGVFLKFDKDIIVGKTAEDEFKHFEAISKALDVAFSEGAEVHHIDLMDNLGSDTRVQKSIADLSKCANEDLKDVLTDMFINISEESRTVFNSSDVFLILYKGQDRELERIVSYFASAMLAGNFKTYEQLRSEGVLELVKSFFNLTNFSITEASSRAFAAAENSMVRAIQIVRSDGSYEKLGKTTEERAREASERSANVAAVAREKQRRKDEKKSTGRRSTKTNAPVNASKDETDVFDGF